jgi:signal transduction histidine kinase
VRHLASVSNRIRGGDIEAKAALTTKDELQDFGETFNQMLDTIRDQRGELEEANRALEERVRERTVRLEEALVHLKGLDRLKDGFISHVAHELRTPLTGAKGSLALLTKKSDLPDRDRELVAIVGRNIDRLIRLVRDMLDLGRIQRDEFRLSITEDTDLRPVIDAAVETIRPLADEAGVSLNTVVPQDLPTIAGDPDRLVQVLLNLLDNAVKFSRTGGAVELTAGAVDGGVALTVRDRGIGIPEEVLGRLFTPFATFHDGRARVEGGTGLGLAIVRAVVNGHGGTVTVTSLPAEGSTFTVWLPIDTRGT